MSNKKILATVLTLAAFSFANAESIAEMKKWEPITKAFQEDIDSLNQSCGLAVKGSIDKKSFSTLNSDEHSINGRCGEAVSAVRTLCNSLDDALKKKLAKKITAINCSFGGAGKRKFTLSSGIVKLAVDVTATDQSAKDNAVLEKIEL